MFSNIHWIVAKEFDILRMSNISVYTPLNSTYLSFQICSTWWRNSTQFQNFWSHHNWNPRKSPRLVAQIQIFRFEKNQSFCFGWSWCHDCHSGTPRSIYQNSEKFEHRLPNDVVFGHLWPGCDEFCRKYHFKPSSKFYVFQYTFSSRLELNVYWKTSSKLISFKETLNHHHVYLTFLQTFPEACLQLHCFLSIQVVKEIEILRYLPFYPVFLYFLDHQIKKRGRIHW